jgi:hypothetical protein
LKWEFFLEIGNLFLEIGKNGPYLALGMGPNIGPVKLAEKVTCIEQTLFIHYIEIRS